MAALGLLRWPVSKMWCFAKGFHRDLYLAACALIYSSTLGLWRQKLQKFRVLSSVVSQRYYFLHAIYHSFVTNIIQVFWLGLALLMTMKKSRTVYPCLIKIIIDDLSSLMNVFNLNRIGQGQYGDAILDDASLYVVISSDNLISILFHTTSAALVQRSTAPVSV